MSIIEKSPHLAWRLVEGHSFVINTKTSMLHEFDEVATFIWKAIDTGITKNELITAMVENYEVTTEQATRDLDEFLATLRENGLIGGV